MYNYCINIVQMLFPLQYFDLWLIPVGPLFPAINCLLFIILGFEAIYGICTLEIYFINFVEYTWHMNCVIILLLE